MQILAFPVSFPQPLPQLSFYRLVQPTKHAITTSILLTLNVPHQINLKQISSVYSPYKKGKSLKVNTKQCAGVESGKSRSNNPCADPSLEIPSAKIKFEMVCRWDNEMG